MRGKPINTRVGGDFATKGKKTTPGMQEKPINTREGGTLARTQERGHMGKVIYYLGYMLATCKDEGCTDEKLKNMVDAAEAIKWNIECIQKAREGESGSESIH